MLDRKSFSRLPEDFKFFGANCDFHGFEGEVSNEGRFLLRWVQYHEVGILTWSQEVLGGRGARMQGDRGAGFRVQVGGTVWVNILEVL